MFANFSRSIVMLVLVASILSYVRAQQAAALPVLTLQESINLAIEKSRSLKTAREAARKAAGGILEAKSAGYPQVGFSTGYIRRDDAYDTLPLAVGFDKTTQQLIVESEPMVLADSSSAGLVVSKVIDINGLLHAATKSANIGAQITDLDLARTRNELILQVKVAYYAALRARDLMAVADEAVKNAQTRLDIAQALVKNGVNPKLDVYRAETSVATAQQNQHRRAQ